MVWHSGTSDPWQSGGANKVHFKGSGKSEKGDNPFAAAPWPSTQLQQIQWSNQELKALSIASCLQSSMVAAGCSRQVAAAGISAAIHTVVGIANERHAGLDAAVSHSHFAIATGQLAQDMIAKRFGSTEFKVTTLADAIKIARRLLPCGLVRKLQDLNSAASYNRHHGACVNSGFSTSLALP